MTVDANLIRMTDKEFQTLTTYIKTKYGIDLTKKRVLIEGRLTNELHKRGMRSFEEYIDTVFKDTTGAEVTLLLNKLTTNLSYFMRENEHFEYLRSQVLPFFEQTRARSHEMRIWSAGCSTGQEPYNIAMVIDEYFGSKKSLWDTRILATDISMNVLGKAKQGVYTADELKDVPDRWKSKYFEYDSASGTFCVIDRIKREVIFQPFNLMNPLNVKKPFDLIVCRNVMIYFDAQTKEQLIERFYQATSDGGYLFIGHSESIGRKNSYTYIQPAIYQRRG